MVVVEPPWHVPRGAPVLRDPVRPGVSICLKLRSGRLSPHPLVLHDLLPFHPKRYALEVVGEGERDGRPVLHFNARPRVGRRESQGLVFRKITRLLVRSTAHSKGVMTRDVVASKPKRRAGRLGFDKRSVQFRGLPGIAATVSLIERKINSKLDAGLFDPGRFR